MYTKDVSKTTRSMYLVASILSMVTGAFFFIVFINEFSRMNSWDWGWWRPTLWEWILVISMMLVSIAMLVLGILTSIKRDRRIVIANLPVTSVLAAVMTFAVFSSNFIDFHLVLGYMSILATLAFLITALCMKTDSPETAKMLPLNKKVEMLKQLKDEGVLSDDELKTLIMKELEK